MEHSRLLKFLLPERDIIIMAESVKIKFDYQSPENVEAEVPGAQKIREASNEDSSDGATLQNDVEIAQNGGENSQNGGEILKVSNENLTVASNDDFSLEPVIVVTKKEATFTKGDIKLQKVTVTEDISINYQHLFKKETKPGKTVDDPENGERIVASYTEVRSIDDDGEVMTRHHQVITKKRNGIHGEPVLMEDKIEDRKTKTKIPVSKFRQTVERVNAERRGSKDKKEFESHIPVRRSSIPKPVKDLKLPPTTLKKEIIITKSDIRKESLEPIITKTVITQGTINQTEPEDEFDKIYAEIVTTPTEVVLDDSLLIPKVEDPEKLESKFEEIIHDYDEHKAEPIDVEIVRRSKIPFLKRRSQQEIELSAQAERTSKIIAARDKLRMRTNSLTKSESFEDELDKELKKEQDSFTSNIDVTNTKLTPTTKTEIKEEKISSRTPNSKTEVIKQFVKTTSTSSSKENEENESSSIVETTTVKKVTTIESNGKEENEQQIIKEENVLKDSIKIGIPVFNSYIHDSSENNETTKTVEVKRILSYTSKNEDLSVIHNVTNKQNESLDTKGEFINISHQISNDIKSETESSENVNSESLASKSNDDEVIIKHFENNIQNEKLVNADKPTAKDVESNKNNVEDEIQFRGKVGKPSPKIESKELIETEANKRESINELTKKKSVLSKIAMFERKETEEPLRSRTIKREIKPPNLIIKDLKRTEHVHVHTPLIVDEVFKPFQADIDLNNENNKEATPVNVDNDGSQVVRAERVTVENSEPVHYALETLVQESKTVEEVSSQVRRDSEYTVHTVEIATITDIQPSKTIKDIPSPRTPNKELNKYEFEEVLPKAPKTTKLNIAKEIQAPVIIPGFKPVSELLRSFESKKEVHKSIPKRTISKVEYTSTVTDNKPLKYTSVAVESPAKTTDIIQVRESFASTTEISYSEPYINENYNDFESNDYKSLDDVFSKESDYQKLKIRQEEDMRRAKSLAELDLGDAVKGKVYNILTRMTSVRTEMDKKGVINTKEMPRKRSVSEKIALFEGKVTPTRGQSALPLRIFQSEKTLTETPRTEQKIEKTRIELTKKHTREVLREASVVETTEKNLIEAERIDKNEDEKIKKKIEDLNGAKLKYGKVENMTIIELSNGIKMPVLAVGTALLDPRVAHHVITAAIDLGYRAIDSAYIYGNEQQVGEAVRAKIADGTVKREELFIMNKLWSTYHRTDLVEEACRASLAAMGLDYFDLYMIHNPMSFKEGGGAIPKIATVIQYSEHDYLDAWYGMETLVAKGLVRAIGVSNFNSVQLQRVLEKGRIKPVVNQVECHPFLSQQRLDLFCSERKVALSCFGVLGAKGTPTELTSGQPAVIDDALVQVMASGLGITPGQLLISYQLQNGHGVVVKSSSASHLWDNLQALNVHLTMGQIEALHAFNRNKRIYTFKGMGDTHKNYPFNIAF